MNDNNELYRSYTKRLTLHIATALATVVFVPLGVVYICQELIELPTVLSLIIGLVVGLVATGVLSSLLAAKTSQPFFTLSKKIHHITSPAPTQDAPPESRLGNEIIEQSVKTILEFMQRSEGQNKHTLTAASYFGEVLDRLPYPVLALDHAQKVKILNKAALSLLDSKDNTEAVDSFLHEVLPLKDGDKEFIPDWITEQQKKTISGSTRWADIKFGAPNRQTYVFDVWGNYVRNDKDGLETTLLLVDKTDDQAHSDLKVDFVAMAAHDLRAPITVIRGYIEALEEELAKKLSVDQKSYLEKLEVSAAQLSSFINNVLNVAKVDRGTLNLTFQKVHWDRLVQETVEQLMLRAKTHGRTIEGSIAGDLPEVMVDPISISEVITNLIDNAIKYSGQSKKIIVKVTVNPDGDVETTIQDFGVGIPSNLMGKLFTKYYRSHLTNRQYAGTGLGLFIAKAIVEAHYGRIWAQSKEGEGSTFGFSLPSYDKIAATLKKGNNTPIIKQSKHGWIKNHTLYRR